MTQYQSIDFEGGALLAAVRRHFQPILSHTGCAIAFADPYTVVMSQGEISLIISVEPGLNQVWLDIDRPSTHERYTLYEIVSAIAPNEMDKVVCHAANSDVLDRCVKKLSDICQQYMRPLLAGDVSTFAKVAQTAEQMRDRATLDATHGADIEQGNLAWEQKQWKKAKELYEAAEPGLSPTEVRRLRFLRKKDLT